MWDLNACRQQGKIVYRQNKIRVAEFTAVVQPLERAGLLCLQGL
ncbi:MAG: hypothetical protein ACI8ZB_002633 [Desulforhopalus sp.]|jgi:hypothetical protein